jgi:hypothetical protein
VSQAQANQAQPAESRCRNQACHPSQEADGASTPRQAELHRHERYPRGSFSAQGTFSISDTPVKILFDSGATHSFISEKLISKLGLKGSHTTSAYKIITPGGQITSNLLIRGVCVGLGSKIIPTNLIVINLVGMDVILGMEWMTQHKVILDISDRVVEINSPTVGHTTLYLPFKDGTDSCAYVTIISPLDEIPVMCEYPDIFPDELPVCHQTECRVCNRTPTGYRAHFQKTLSHATQRVSRTENSTPGMLNKGYICPSSSP